MVAGPVSAADYVWFQVIVPSIDTGAGMPRVGWVAASDALLVLDRNANGLVDNSSEISFVADKPAEGKQRITFMMSVDTDVEPRPRAGDRALIGITEGEDTPDLWATGKGIATDRAWIEKALPGARGAEC